MKKYFILLLVIYAMAFNPSKAQKVNPNTLTYKSEIAFSVNEKDLIPEGIAYDKKTGKFFLGSLNKQKIIAVEKNGKHSDFVKSGQDGLLMCLGLKVDLQRRRLWALSRNGSQSSVHIYNIDNGELIKKFSSPQGKNPGFNDLILSKDGSAYITAQAIHSIFYVPSNLRELSPFVSSDSLMTGPNGISISTDDSILYVATRNGIVQVDLKSKSVSSIENWLQADTRGVDGMMFYKNSLICIRSGDKDKSKHHFTRYRLSKDGKEIIAAEIIDHKNKLFDEPTTGVIVDNYFYALACTSLGYLSNKMEELKNPLVLKYRLD
jgi:sugar lactone lactonase YvrE